MMPPFTASSLRTRWLLESAMKTLPPPSTAISRGTFKLALVAGPPSPPNPATPFPATVVMMPVAVATRRTRWLLESAMNTLPAPSTATPDGFHNEALVPAPPSPLKPSVPLPATVLRTPVLLSFRMRWL